MSLLPSVLLYLAVGCSEWYLAVRRTLACARGEKAVLVSIVFVENMLGLWVLSDFVRTCNWWIALAYSTGGAAGALMVNLRESGAKKARRQATRRARARKPAALPDPAPDVVVAQAPVPAGGAPAAA